MIPLHGRINCSVCFNGSSTWGESISEDEGWRLENNPCAWGSATPKVLILGFSKGYNQTTNLASRDFNDIPFSGWRDRLDLALRKVGVLPEFLSVNEKISDSENNDTILYLTNAPFPMSYLMIIIKRGYKRIMEHPSYVLKHCKKYSNF